MSAPSDFREDRVRAALAGTNPMVLRRLDAGFAVIGDHQHLPGYCVLITDDPEADQLTDLSPERQVTFLEDAAVLVRAVTSVCRRWDPQFRRINLEIQGNTDAFLHAHVTPRYQWEPAEVVGWPAALHHWEGLAEPRPALDHEFDPLRAALAVELAREQVRRHG